jgi:hypothetical protein
MTILKRENGVPVDWVIKWSDLEEAASPSADGPSQADLARLMALACKNPNRSDVTLPYVKYRPYTPNADVVRKGIDGFEYKAWEHAKTFAFEAPIAAISGGTSLVAKVVRVGSSFRGVWNGLEGGYNVFKTGKLSAEDVFAISMAYLDAKGLNAELGTGTGVKRNYQKPKNSDLDRFKKPAIEDVVPPPANGPGSATHRAERWSDYQGRGGKWSYERWSKQYDVNMNQASRANSAVDKFHEGLGWGEREVTIDVEGVPRRLDIADRATMRGVEHKTGYQSLTRDNAWEITRDEILMKQGWSIRWQFDGDASKPLLKALNDAGIPHN